MPLLPHNPPSRKHTSTLAHSFAPRFFGRDDVDGFGRLDTLVNNARISMHARFDELNDLDAVDRVTRINYLGSVYCTHFALPHLKRTRGRQSQWSGAVDTMYIPAKPTGDVR